MRSSAVAAPGRDRLILWATIVAVSVLAWACVISISSGMPESGMSGTGMQAMTQPNPEPWRALDLLLAFGMWAVMMVAMMTPTAAPMLLTLGHLVRQRSARHRFFAISIAFLAGYILVWLGFSAGATALQWGLHSARLLSAGVIRATPAVGGLLLVLAGAYQFTALKDRCASVCRSPIDFLMTEWRDGTRGALQMGVRHGVYCVGCCWLLMLVLFAVGVMNLVWVALIAVAVLFEKAIPGGRLVTLPVGVLLVGWGAWLLARTIAG